MTGGFWSLLESQDAFAYSHKGSRPQLRPGHPEGGFQGVVSSVGIPLQMRGLQLKRQHETGGAQGFWRGNFGPAAYHVQGGCGLERDS